jgi:hypothetical protein
MQKFFDSWREFVQEKEPKKEQKLLNEANEDWGVVRTRKEPRGANYATSRHRANIQRMRNTYDDIVTKIAKEYGLNKGLLFGTMFVETGGLKANGMPQYGLVGSNIKGKRGNRDWRARGLMQVGHFHAQAAAREGRISREDYDSGKWWKDPEMNIRLGAHFLRKLQDGYTSEAPQRGETAEEARKRAATVNNMSSEDRENLLHVAYSHGAGNSSARKAAREGYSSITSHRSAAYSYPRIAGVAKRIIAETEPDAVAALNSYTSDGAGSTTSVSNSGVKNVIISGNSHAGAMAAAIKQHYENLGQQTGAKYNFVEIHEPQGYGGQVSALSQKMDAEVPNKLEGNDIAAIIHVGTNTGHGNLDELIEKYRNLSNNVTFVGTPEANKNYEDYQQRTNFNTELENKINNLDGVNFVNTFGLTTQNDLSDDVHLRTAAYGNLWSQIQGDINFDSSSSASSMAGGPSTSATPQPINRGQFVHGFSRDDVPDFNFDDFYKKLDDAGLTHHLGDWGKDYKYGRAHDAARAALVGYEASNVPVIDVPVAGAPIHPDDMLSPQLTVPQLTDMPVADAPIHPDDMFGPQLTESGNIESNLWGFRADDYMKRENKDLKSIISHEYNLFEQANRWSSKDLIKVAMTLRFDKEFSFYGNVLNQIRAVKGITIAKADEAGLVKISPDKRLVLLHLKFMPDRPLSQYIYYLKTELKKIKDKDGDRVLSIDLKSIPEKTKS